MMESLGHMVLATGLGGVLSVLVAAMLTVQVGPVPEQPPPDHTVTVDPVDGVAVRVTRTGRVIRPH